MKVNKILAIAITHYDDMELNKIENCFNDINKILKVLTGRYVFDEVEFIHEKKDTTRKNLYSRLNEFLIHTTPDDNVLILFAGHGQYNEMLGLAFWQPSDADPSDPSSWINISDLMAFIRVAKAKHVSIISDSCFAGAIFEPPKRGGGISALDSKRSREALASGSIERVSDGKGGESSPFTKTLIEVLQKNEAIELPFSALANQVIIEFDPRRKQTPQFGSLIDVGHDGGTFILHKKIVEKKLEEVGDANEFLSRKLENLYIELPDELLDLSKKALELKKEKNAQVKKQRFEEAAQLRDQEKALYTELEGKVDTLLDRFLVVDLNKEDNAASEKLDLEFKEYIDQTKKEKEEFEKVIAEWRQKKKEADEPGAIEVSEQEMRFATGLVVDYPIDRFFPTKEDPVKKQWLNKREELSKKYFESVIQLSVAYGKFKGGSKNPFLISKEVSLRNAIKRIVFFEVALLTGGMRSDIEEAIEKKQIELDFLTWISTNE